MTNRLAGSRSPYLQQHAENPVDWYEWGDDAFAAARERDVPILLSVGYAACHWCHVMAHESFSDETIAALMNEHFVNVKVDREERPDVDSVYMAATQALTGQGGWPMTVFLTPDGEPFYAGTYYPPEPRHGIPSFPQLLAAIAAAWQNDRERLQTAATGITAELATAPVGSVGDAPPDAGVLSEALSAIARQFDTEHAGFAGAPKFPPSMVLEWLLRHHGRTGSSDALAMAEQTFERMARGGLYDQLGGGFARYAVDRTWTVPHFEKMLYDNALLLRTYVHWWRVSGSSLAERVVRDTVGFLLRELRTAEGGFASSLDADTEGVEGKFYVWTPAELTEILGTTDGGWAAQLFDVREQGSFEHGTSVLQLPVDPADGELDRFAGVRARLLAARSRRVAPARDDKVVAAWNGLLIAALAEAGALAEEPSWVDAARAAAELLVDVHLTGDQLVRISRDGVAGVHAGVLEDYADVAEGFLALYSVTAEPRWVDHAGVLLDAVLERFPDGAGGFYDTASDAAALVRRPQDPTDNAAPSGQTAAAGALLTYAALTGSQRHREAAESALAVVARLGGEHPRFMGWGLAVAEALVDGPREVAVVGPLDDPATIALHRTALRAAAPGAVVALGEPGTAGVGLLAERPLVDGRPAAYVCRHFVCDAPVTDPAALTARLTPAE